MNVSTRYSELYLYIYQCYFCQNGEAFEALLQMIGTRIWTDAEQLLGDLLQQVPQLLQVDHNDGVFFRAMEWSMVFEKKPL